MSTETISHKYAWSDNNMMKGFNTWEEEIAHVENLGYKLVPAEYYLPHWSTAMQMGDVLPKIYVLRNAGPDLMTCHFDCYAARLGYPVYFKP